MDKNLKNNIEKKKAMDQMKANAVDTDSEKIDVDKKDTQDNIKTKIPEKLKGVVVNINEIAEAEARKAADAYMTESKKDGYKNIFKRIWKHTFFDEYYRQKEVSRVRNEINNSDNIYIGRTGEDKVAHENAMQAITERFASEYEGTLSEGEKKEILDDSNPEQLKIKEDIKNLLNEYAKGNLDDEAFRNQKVRILDGLNNGNGNKSKKSFNNYADNLLELAQNARLAISHGAKIEELDYDLDIIVGNAKSSLKTEAHLNKVDKCIDKMKKSKIGRFISPAVLNTSVGIAYSLSVLLTKKAAGLTSSIIPLLGSVVVSSAFAGMNESQRLALERAQHGTEMAEGGEFEEGSKKREQFEKFAYQMESSSALAASLRGLMFERDENNKDVVKDIKQEDLEKIFANLANIDARKSLNASKKIDLISYSGIGNVEKESTDLTILVAKAKVELRKKIEGDLKKGIPEGKTFDEYLAEQTQAVSDSLLGGEKGITAQDKAFKKFKTKEVAKKVLKTATFGFVIGGTLQEAMAFGNDNTQGMVEGIFHHDANATIQTPFDHIKDWITGHPTHMGMNNAVETVLNDGHHIVLPNGTSILENPDGTFDILKGDTVISDNIDLNFDANGNLDSDSLARLGEAGIVGNTTHNIVDGTKEVTSDAEGYVNNHSGSTHNIAHDGWYDDDTPKPIFEQNELKLQWGGEAGSAGIENGNYVLDVSHMTSGGSFHQEFSMDAQEAIKNGGLKIILSLTEGTQSQVFEVPIDINGQAIIDPDSEIGKLFFGTENGHAVFRGRFAEVVQSFGDKGGVEHVKSLATLVGPGNDSIQDVIPTHIDVPVTNLDVPVGVQQPLFVPIMSRRPLESLKKKDNGDKKIVEDKKDDIEDHKIEDKIDVVPEVIVPSGMKAIEFKVSPEERKGMEDDVRMINRKEIESKGIITVARLDFKSEYGRRRYDELKNIPDGKPVIFNKSELMMIGDEIDNFLRGDRKVEYVEVKPVGNKEEREAERDRSVNLLGPDGMPINKKVEKSSSVVEKKIEEKKKDTKIEDSNITENKKVENIEEAKVEKKDESKKEEIFTYKDLSKFGTEFESKDFFFKTISTKKSFLGGKTIIIEGTNKETGQKELYSYKEKFLKKNLEKGALKINKVQEQI